MRLVYHTAGMIMHHHGPNARTGNSTVQRYHLLETIADQSAWRSNHLPNWSSITTLSHNSSLKWSLAYYARIRGREMQDLFGHKLRFISPKDVLGISNNFDPSPQRLSNHQKRKSPQPSHSPYNTVFGEKAISHCRITAADISTTGMNTYALTPMIRVTAKSMTSTPLRCTPQFPVTATRNRLSGTERHFFRHHRRTLRRTLTETRTAIGRTRRLTGSSSIS
jgi:hypothetical protein